MSIYGGKTAIITPVSMVSMYNLLKSRNQSLQSNGIAGSTISDSLIHTYEQTFRIDDDVKAGMIEDLKVKCSLSTQKRFSEPVLDSKPSTPC